MLAAHATSMPRRAGPAEAGGGGADFTLLPARQSLRRQPPLQLSRLAGDILTLVMGEVYKVAKFKLIPPHHPSIAVGAVLHLNCLCSQLLLANCTAMKVLRSRKKEGLYSS